MHQLITKDYNGFQIEFELIDGQVMANATSMCAAFGKRPSKWLELESTKRYIGALEAKSEFRTLLETRQGGNNSGTWVHERLVLKLAQWLNVDFEIQCDEWIAELLRTGRVEIAPPKTQAEMLLMFAQHNVEQERRMTAIEETVQEVKAHLTTINTDFYSVAGWAALVKKPIPTNQATALGKKAAKLSRESNMPIGSIYDARYGNVGTYHKDILRQVF